MRSRNNFILMETYSCHRSFMSLDLNLTTSAELYKIQDINNSTIGTNNELATIMVNIIATHILPMLSTNINLTFSNIPQTQHLCAAIDKLGGIFGKSDCFCCILGSYYLLQHHSLLCVVEEYVVVAVVDVEVFTAI